MNTGSHRRLPSSPSGDAPLAAQLSPAELRADCPATLGYRWPAEWEAHEATWLSWPHNPETWPGKFDVIPPAYARMVQAIARFEPVHILASGPVQHDAIQQLQDRADNIHLHDVPTNDAWTRDHGPIFLLPRDNRSEARTDDAPRCAALIDWQYNAWGAKYPPFDKDNAVPAQVAELLGLKRFASDMVLEGGAIDGNGLGTILTTRSCLLHAGRNPGSTQQQITQQLGEMLAVRHVIWLSGDAIQGDDTDGHIDQLARFVSPSTVLVAQQSDRDDPDHQPLAKLWRELSEASDQDGRPLQLIPLPMPAPKYFQEHRLPASYCNFYLVNGGVIVPQFGDPADQRARTILAEAFPDREIVGVEAIDLVWGLGAVHCLTQQQPRWPHDPLDW